MLHGSNLANECSVILAALRRIKSLHKLWLYRERKIQIRCNSAIQVGNICPVSHLISGTITPIAG